MVFSSIPFLFYFLPATLLLYFCVPNRMKNGMLLLASLVFYAWGEPRLLLFLLCSVVQGYAFGRLIARYRARQRLAKTLLVVSVSMSLGLLVFCKYTDFLLENWNWLTGQQIPLLHLALPIGISFYTFQILSYTVDVFRGTVPAQRNFLDFALYAAMFPQLIAGPIVRYADIAGQLRHRTHSIEQAADGIRRFTVGLAKKVLVANVLSEVCTAFYNTQEPTILFFWLYAVAASLYIYFDFSGYSDMAIGLAGITGFTLPENFRHPYASGSITEFWRRWHMSLGSWFRDYVYIPMGGNRVSRGRWVCNILTVWMLTGFWHGAAWSYMLWGLYFAVLLLVEKLWLHRFLERLPVLRHVYVCLAVAVSFVLFDAASAAEGIARIGGMFGYGSPAWSSAESLYYLRSYGWLLVLAAIGSTPIVTTAVKRLRASAGGAKILQKVEAVLLAAAWILVTAALVNGSFQPFLYFRF